MHAAPPIIGIDFDNTLVSYDALFHRVALEQRLIPADLPVNKTAVRDHLRREGREPAWTEMQGVVYGTRIVEAAPFPGALDFIRAGLARGWTVHIVSHKTRTPFLGEPVDLHAAARRWLEAVGLVGGSGGLPAENVWLELTKQEKVQRIAKLGCHAFIDDLPEFLLDPAFPRITRLLFDPAHATRAQLPAHSSIRPFSSWAEIQTEIEHVFAG
jgi:hypothetical protein